MASKKIKGITIEIGGDTTKLGDALKDSEKQTKSLQGELKQVEKLLQFDPSNTELVAQKQEILTKAIAETAKKLETLEEAQKQVKAQFDNNEIGADQYRAFQREVIKTQKSLDDLKGELNTLESGLNSVESETVDTVSTFDKLSDEINQQEKELKDLKKEYTNLVLEQKDSSTEANDLREKMSKLSGEIKENKDKMSQAKKEADQYADSIEDVGDEAEESSDGFTIMGGALADLVASAIKGAISAIGDLVGALLDLSEATEEYRQMQGKLEGSSETFGYSVDFAKGKYEEFYKYLGDDQASTNAITNLMGLGTSTENLSDIANGAIGVWASYGDSIPIESLTESINETVNAGKVTGTFADTINWCKDANTQLNGALSGNKTAQKAFNDALKEGLPVEDAFNEALAKITDEQERADVVAKFLNSTYGESKKKYDELNGSILDANEAELKLKDTQAQLGEAVEPVNTAITNLKDKALDAIAPVVEKLADAFSKLLNWLVETPGALETVTTLIIILSTAFTILAGALAIQGIIAGVTKAIAFLNTTLLANPIVLIVALIAGLVAGFIYLWNTCEPFKQFFIDLWDAIKKATKVAVDAIAKFFTVTIPEKWNQFKKICSNFITSVVNYFKQLPGKIKTIMTNFVNTVKNFFQELPYKVGYFIGQMLGHIIQFGINIINFARTKIPEFISNVVNFFKQLPSKIWNAIKSAISKIGEWGSQIKSKATSAIKNMVSSVISTAKSLPSKIKSAIWNAISIIGSWGSSMLSKAKSAITKVVDGIKNTFKKLPSQLKSIGKDLVKGLWNGISNAKDWILGKVKSFGKGILNGLKDFFGIKSPSRVMRDEIGRYIAEGIGTGITENADNPIEALETLGDDMVNGAKGINGITLNRQLENTFSGTLNAGGSIGDLIAVMENYLPQLIEASHHDIRLDDDTLIGKTIKKIDQGLATNYKMKARGI